VILSSTLVHIENDPVTGDEIETFVPGVFLEKKVPFALRSQSSSTQSLWYQVARCVGHGIDRQVAIDAATKVPARLLGLEDRVGSLEVGKDGNVLLLSGDPLSVTTFVEHVFIEGQHAYDRSKDVRVKQLQTGEQPENTAATETQPDLDAEDDENDDDGEDDDSGEDD
jgi:adenine deaminase